VCPRAGISHNYFFLKRTLNFNDECPDSFKYLLNGSEFRSFSRKGFLRVNKRKRIRSTLFIRLNYRSNFLTKVAKTASAFVLSKREREKAWASLSYQTRSAPGKVRAHTFDPCKRSSKLSPFVRVLLIDR
jgi:hypothetical protein